LSISVTDPRAGDPPQSAALLKAWDAYVAASQAIVERLSDPLRAGANASMSIPVLGAWQQFANSLGMNVNSAPGHFRPEELMTSLAPALGYAREYQLIVQRMLELGSQFQRCYADFQKQSALIGEMALQAVQKRAAADPTLAKSTAAAYDAWIDSAEEAYAQTAHSEPFARSLGELCNLLSAFKVERGKLLEALARHLDLPSRAEVDTLHRKVNELGAALHTAAPGAAPPAAKVRKSRKPAAP
jgi:class III poly(R)-hydroxyalkanoic acid synthase PhaE subunit